MRVGVRRVRVRQSDLDQFLDVSPAIRKPAAKEPTESAWAAFAAAMSDATATLEQADRDELVGALDRLTAATRRLAKQLRA